MTQRKNVLDKICASVFLKLVKNVFHSNTYLESYTQNVDPYRHWSSCQCLFLLRVTKLEFVEMHKHTMKLCSASLELLYTNIEGIKDVFEIVFCKPAQIEDAVFWDVTLNSGVDTSDMLTTLQNITSQKLESSTSAPWKPNVT